MPQEFDYRRYVNSDIVMIRHDDHNYYYDTRVPAGALNWAYKTFPQDPTVKQNRICYILGNLMFAYEEDYMLYRLTWL